MLNSIPVFGEARSTRFMRKTRKEVSLMEQEQFEEVEELNAYFDYEHPEDRPWSLSPNDDEMDEVGDTHDDGDYDDFDYELMMRSSDYL